jgi:hypothetical protein
MTMNHHLNGSRPACSTPKLSFALIAALCLLAGVNARAQTYLFDFGAVANTTQNGPSPEDPVNFWNNVTDAIGIATNGLLTNIVTAANSPSTLGFAILSRFNGANGNGHAVAVPTAPFPVEATRDSLYGNTEIFNGLTNIYPSFKLTGLDPATAYDFTFYASRTGVGDNRETGYIVTGGNNGFGALNAANNISNMVKVLSIHPTADGEITVSMAPTANNNNANHFTYIGVLKLDAAPPQTPIGFTLQPTNTRAVEFGSVTFSAAVTGAPPYFVQWLSNGLPIAGANQFSYTIPSTTLTMDGSLFSVNVSNLAFSATSTNAALRVVNDIVPPVFLSVSTADGITVLLTFDEPLSQAEAEEPSNFTINNTPGGVVSSVLSTNGRVVTLTLDTAVTGTFTVTAQFQADLSGNYLETATLTGTVPNPETQMILVDFGGGLTTEHGAAPFDDPIRYWNNLQASIGQTDNGVLSSLVTTQNLMTPIGITMVARFNGLNESGTLDTNAPFATDATRDSLFGNTELFGGFTNIFPIFRLTGLNPARGYSLGFYASRTGVADVRQTLYTVTGAATTTTTLNAANNITNIATVAGVQPNASGEITISLTPGPLNNNANHFTYLGVLTLTPGGPQTRFLAPTLSGGAIQLQWTGSGTLQAAPTVTGPWEPVTPTGANSHIEPLTSTNRFFRILLP